MLAINTLAQFESVPVKLGTSILVRQLLLIRSNQDSLVVGFDTMPFNMQAVPRLAVNNASSGRGLSVGRCESSQVVGRP